MGQITNPWTPGTTYPPGSTVRPTSPTGAKAAKITTNGANDGFELGNLTDWTSSGAWTVVNTLPYQGTYSAKLPAASGTKTLIGLQAATGPGNAGQIVTGWCYANLTTNASLASAACTLTLYDSGHSVIGTLTGAAASPTGVSGWVRLTCSGAVLIGTAYIAIGVTASSVAADVFVDSFGWDLLVNPYDNPLLFYAVQTGTGKSGQVEPIWPTTPPPPTVTVNDGTVVWSNVAPTEIVWLALPLLQSGSVEPGGATPWPTVAGQVVHDPLSGTPGMEWQAQTPQVPDTNVPSTTIRAMGASKIFAGNHDIVGFCATMNALDWTTKADAGFIPTGLQNYGDQDVAAMNIFRSNLAVFNAQGLQIWQIDEDPANMALIDALPIGCTRKETVVPVNDDLFFLNPVGVRTVGISAGSTNLMAGDVGQPIDPLVQDAYNYALTNNLEMIGTYFPGLGQYWLAFPAYIAPAGTYVSPGTATSTTVFVYTMSRRGEVGAWTRYLLPFLVEVFTQHGDYLYVRGVEAGGVVGIYKVDLTQLNDLLSTGTSSFNATVQWPWLDVGAPGADKKMSGFDVICRTQAAGSFTLEVGSNENDPTVFTTPFSINVADTVPNFMYPLEIVAPSLAPRLTFPSALGFELFAMNLYLDDEGTQ